MVPSKQIRNTFNRNIFRMFRFLLFTICARNCSFYLSVFRYANSNFKTKSTISMAYSIVWVFVMEVDKNIIILRFTYLGNLIVQLDRHFLSLTYGKYVIFGSIIIMRFTGIQH